MDDCPGDLTFHLQRSGRSKCPRRRDFNSLYIKDCGEVFGGRKRSNDVLKAKGKNN